MTRLTKHDLFATALTAAIVLVYAAYRTGTWHRIVASTEAASGVVLVIGAAVCSVGRTADLYGRVRTDNMMVLAIPASLLGSAALTASVLAVTTGSALALAVQVATSVGLWLTIPLRSLLDGAPKAG